MKTVAKKISAFIFKFIAWLLVVFTVFMMVFTIFTVTTVDKNDRSIFGLRFYIVLTDSMSLSENNKDMEVHFNAGDIILITNVKDPTALQPGDIIAFMSTNNESYGQTVTHMIREAKLTADGRLLGYVTFGTNTNTNDEALVEPSYVLGQYAGKLPALGHFFAFMKTTPGYIICILIPFLLLIIYNGVNVIRLFRKYRKEQMQEMETEKAQIAEERAKTEDMMRELLALKAQLEQQSQPQAAPTNVVAAETKPAEADTAPAASDEKSENN